MKKLSGEFFETKDAKAAGKESEDFPILALRSQARQLQETNNQLVKQLWEVEQQLISEDLAADKKSDGLDRKAHLIEQISEGNYIQKIERLLQEINQLETALYGHSDVNSHSPYLL